MQKSGLVDVLLSPTHDNQQSFLGIDFLSDNQQKNIGRVQLSGPHRT